MDFGGFLREDEQHPKAGTPAELCAAQLINVLRAKKLLQRSPNPGRWAKEFERLIESEGEDKVRRVLNWYAANAGFDRVPQTFSAASFRREFARLEKRADRNPAATAVSPEATYVISLFENCTWPMGSDLELPAVVQLSLDNYVAFNRKIDHYLTAYHVKSKAPMEERTPILKQLAARRLWEYMRTTYFTRPRSFLPRWFAFVNGQVRNWRDWNGSLHAFAFSEDSRILLRHGRHWSNDYCGKSARWDDAVDCLNEEWGKR